MDSLYNNSQKFNTKQLNMDLTTLMRYLHGGGSPITFPGAGCNAFSSPTMSGKFSSTSSSSSGRSFGRPRSLSPLSALENVKSPPPIEEEDVLVMDGILVASVRGGRVSRSLPSDSGGSLSNSSSPADSVYKMELCRAWEDLGRCRYGSKCQFAHGKEELCPTHVPVKNKTEANKCKSYATASYPYGPKCRFTLPVKTDVLVAASRVASSTRPECTCKSPAITIKPEYSSKNTTPTTAPKHDHLGRNPTPTATKPEHSNKSPIAQFNPEDSGIRIMTINNSDYWSPLDDDIEVALASQTDKCPTREDVDAYINNVLHGTTSMKRLPVFTEFCPD